MIRLNEKGQSEEEFLKRYNKDAYPKASHTVDILIFTKKEDKLSILLIKRKNHPCIGMWALPGGFVNMDESLLDAAKRELLEETNVSNAPLSQLITLGDLGRDPRDRNISTGYISLIEECPIVFGDDAADARWFDISIKEEENFGDNKLYSLLLINEEEINVKIRVYFNENLLTKYRVKIIENEDIAFDHTKYLGYGLLRLMDKKIINF
ncbi:MAG: NUDIX hydrolase [Clostridiaceae bacterium]